MREAAILRVVATVAGVLIIGIGALLGGTSLKQSANKWWATALGLVLSAVIVYVGYKTIRSGNFGAFYNN